MVQSGLGAERLRIHAHGEQYGKNAVWVDEVSAPGRSPDPFESIDDFLYELERSKLYLALIATDWPGTPIPIGADTSNVTFFETELFYAAVLGHPIAVVFRTDIPVPPDTSNLLALLQRALPRIAWNPVSSARDAEEVSKRIIDQAASGHAYNTHRRREFGRILHRWWDWREPVADAPGLRWLDGRFLATQDPPRQAVVEGCLDLVVNVHSERQRLSRLWIAARELMGIPHNRTNDEHWLGLWNGVLTAWSKSSAWYGLHGHLELGYMAALYSLDDIRNRGRRLNPKLMGADWDPPYSALGSAYYAAAHRVASQRLRGIGLRKALALVDRAVSTDALTRSNTLAIRGSILQKLGAFASSVDTYREVLRIRRAANAPQGSIGEAMSELGFGLLFRLRWREGRDLLREGVALMETGSSDPGFVVRGKRKLAAALYLTGRISAAHQQRKEADELAARATIGVTVP